MNEIVAGQNLIELIKRGGVYYNIGGSTVKEVLTDLTEVIHLPPSLKKESLLNAILEREELMPTAIGNGIALPHPRNPVITRSDEQFVTIGFLQRPIDWKALDGKPVWTVILIVSSSPKNHLWTLSRISFLCQQTSFRQVLEQRASKEELIKAIQEVEQTWK